MTAAEADESTAALLDERYQLGECVGEGGMARVFRAQDVLLGRTVAIKLIKPGVDGASSERARSEMTVLASLNHPSLVTLFDARLGPGQPEYLAMEFIDGPTLAARLASGPLPAEIVAHLAADLAEALHVVHKAGIVHRDIKPSNVLLSPAQMPGSRPRAKLADFGIAYLLDGSRLTSPGLVIGTVAYLAPEQLRGGDAVPASDVYSLGLVLLEALTGDRLHPHGGGAAAALTRLESPPALPDEFGPRWRDLLARMLATEPSERPTPAEVVTAAGELSARMPDARAAMTAATTPLTAPTLVAPVGGGLAAAAAAASVPPSRGPNVSERGVTADRRAARRKTTALVSALAAAAVAIAAVAGFSMLGSVDQTPEPALTVPAEPTQAPPVEENPVEENPVEDVVNNPGRTEEERKQAEEEQKRLEEEQKKAEEAQKKAEEEQRKQAEEEQKRLEEEQKKLEEEQGDDDGEGDG